MTRVVKRFTARNYEVKHICLMRYSFNFNSYSFFSMEKIQTIENQQETKNKYIGVLALDISIGE